MKKLMMVLGLVVTMNVVMPSSAYATGWFGHHEGGSNWFQNIFSLFTGGGFGGNDHQGGGHQHGAHCGHNAVPEIDAAGAAIALALLGGVVSIGRERRKK